MARAPTRKSGNQSLIDSLLTNTYSSGSGSGSHSAKDDDAARHHARRAQATGRVTHVCGPTFARAKLACAAAREQRATQPTNAGVAPVAAAPWLKFHFSEVVGANARVRAVDTVDVRIGGTAARVVTYRVDDAHWTDVRVCTRCNRVYREIDNLARHACRYHPGARVVPVGGANALHAAARSHYAAGTWSCCGRTWHANDGPPGARYEATAPYGCTPCDHTVLSHVYTTPGDNLTVPCDFATRMHDARRAAYARPVRRRPTPLPADDDGINPATTEADGRRGWHRVAVAGAADVGVPPWRIVRVGTPPPPPPHIVNYAHNIHGTTRLATKH